MLEINGYEHVLILTDEIYVDRRVCLQKREIVKGSTGGGSVGEPLMLKSEVCYLNCRISDKSIEVRKRVCALN